LDKIPLAKLAEITGQSAFALIKLLVGSTAITSHSSSDGYQPCLILTTIQQQLKKCTFSLWQTNTHQNLSQKW